MFGDWPARPALPLVACRLKEYEEAFRAVDSSGNGTIGGTELAQLFKSLGTPLSYENLAEVGPG